MTWSGASSGEHFLASNPVNNSIQVGLPTGGNDTAMVLAAIAKLGANNPELVFQGGTYRFSTVASGVCLLFSGLNGLTVRGVGRGTVLLFENATATEFIRFNNCNRLIFRDVWVQITNGAVVTHAVHYTCDSPATVHNASFSDIDVTNPSQVGRFAWDCFTVVGSGVITSASAAFAAGDIGGTMGVAQQSGDPLAAPITAVATRTQTINNGGLVSSVQTSLPLTGAIAGAPTGQYTIKVESEIMLVTAGGQTATLTVSRGYNQTTAATHTDGLAVTTYQATYAPVDGTPSLTAGPVPAFIQTPASATIYNGISVGADHPGASDMDIAQTVFTRCRNYQALEAGWRLGNGTTGNVLNTSFVSCEVSQHVVGIVSAGAPFSWNGPSVGSNGIDFKVTQPGSQPISIQAVRSEVSGQLYVAAGLSTNALQQVAIRDTIVDSYESPDGVVIRHQWSAPLTLDAVSLRFITPGQTVSIVCSGADTTHPCYYSARNVASNGGNPSPHPAAAGTIIRDIFGGPRLSGAPSDGVINSYGAVRDSGTAYGMQTSTPTGASVTYTPDGTLGAQQEIIQGTTAQTLTIAAPTNRLKGQIHTFKFVHFADVSTWTLTWNAVYKRAGGAFANTNTSGAVDTISFFDDGTNLRETSRALALA